MNKKRMVKDSGKNAPAHVTEGSVFDDLGLDKVESSALKMKTSLLDAIQGIVAKRGYKQRALEKILDQPQPRVSELLRGKISKLSIERLLDYLQRLGGLPEVHIRFHNPAKTRYDDAAEAPASQSGFTH